MTSIAMLCAVCLATTCSAAESISRDELGREVKLTILVDKVMQPTEGWVTKEWMVQEAARAGFNVFSPRKGYDRLDEVSQVAQWCRRSGIFHMPWMRGTLAAPAVDAPNADDARGRRVVWPSGNEQPLWSVNSDEFWQWTTKYIIEYAKISAENEHLMGVFLDYENYAPGKEGNLYSLSYDDTILGKFAQAQGIELPRLANAERKKWLLDNELHDPFEQFQVDHWRERCRALREAVDEYAPKFQFCIYPAPGTPFMVQACYPEWSTDKAPVILADPYVYGRPSRFLPQKEALEANLRKLTKGLKTPTEAGIPFIYAGGIDPVVTGADPEFCGKNAVMISETTDGYWIFYEGPKYDKDHPEYFKWFTWANGHIAASTFATWHEPRENPEDWSLDVFGDADRASRFVPPDITGEKVAYPAVRMRLDNLLFVACKAGEPVEIEMQNIPVGNYESLLVWDVRDAKLSKVASGTIENNQSGFVRFTPEIDGLYLLGVSAGSCAYSVVGSNMPMGLFAAERASFIHGADRLYFMVPQGVAQFELTVTGAGVETVRLNVLDPEGVVAATGQTTPAQGTTAVKVSAGEHAGKVWSLQITRADEGVLEDNWIKLDPQLPATLSFAPEHVFSTRPQQ